LWFVIFWQSWCYLRFYLWFVIFFAELVLFKILFVVCYFFAELVLFKILFVVCYAGYAWLSYWYSCVGSLLPRSYGICNKC
jgi:hypothetical protein